LLDSATDQARQLNRLVENLLNMTRLESGSVHLNLEPTDLQDLVGSVVQQFSGRMKNRPLRLEIPDNLPLVPMDTMLVAQVITNLLDNACKYSPEDSPIVVGVELQADAIEVFVRDSGIGLPENELEKVFVKFYRGANNKNSTGTGLGLSICKGIIEAHGGWIKASRNPDRGLTLRFSLPIKNPSEEENE